MTRSPRGNLRVPGQTDGPDQARLLGWQRRVSGLQAARGWRVPAWPKMRDGAMRLTAAQFSALFEGLNGKRVHAPIETRVPEQAG